jgi:hypothetical protein
MSTEGTPPSLRFEMKTATLRQRQTSHPKPHRFKSDDGLYCWCNLPEKNDVHASAFVITESRFGIWGPT